MSRSLIDDGAMLSAPKNDGCKLPNRHLTDTYATPTAKSDLSQILQPSIIDAAAEIIIRTYPYHSKMRSNSKGETWWGYGLPSKVPNTTFSEEFALICMRKRLIELLPLCNLPNIAINEAQKLPVLLHLYDVGKTIFVTGRVLKYLRHNPTNPEIWKFWSGEVERARGYSDTGFDRAFLHYSMYKNLSLAKAGVYF